MHVEENNEIFKNKNGGGIIVGFYFLPHSFLFFYNVYVFLFIHKAAHCIPNEQ